MLEMNSCFWVSIQAEDELMNAEDDLMKVGVM